MSSEDLKRFSRLYKRNFGYVSLYKNIFYSIRLNISSDNYSTADTDPSSNYESDYDDETTKGYEIDSDLINMIEEDQDMVITQSADEIKTDKENFAAMRLLNSINSAVKNSYFHLKINNKPQSIHQQTGCWLLTETFSHLSTVRPLRSTECKQK